MGGGSIGRGQQRTGGSGTEEQLSASYWKIRTQKVTGAQLMDDVK